MNRFWRWVKNKNPAEGEPEERTLFLNGTIAEESWFDDDVTPAHFKSDLEAGDGNITVWIDGLAASAASVIAMAGDTVLMSPVAMLMIHNPATIAMGDHNDMQKAIDMLSGVKDSIINAYAAKTGMSRNKLSRLMEDETWMDATKAVELGFADSVIERAAADDLPAEDDETEDGKGEKVPSMLFSRKAFAKAVTNKITDHIKSLEPEPEEVPAVFVPAGPLMDRLRDIKKSF